MVFLLLCNFQINNDVYNISGLGDDDDTWGDGDEEF